MNSGSVSLAIGTLKPFNLPRLRAKTKSRIKCLRDLLFADDAALTTHSAEDLQQLMNRFSKACQEFGLIISLKKMQVMGQDVNPLPSISISDCKLEVVHDFVYLGSSISDSLSFDTEVNWVGYHNHVQTDKESVD